MLIRAACLAAAAIATCGAAGAARADAPSFAFCEAASTFNVNATGFTSGIHVYVWAGGFLSPNWWGRTVDATGGFQVSFDASLLPTTILVTDDNGTPLADPVGVGMDVASCTSAPLATATTSKISTTATPAVLRADGTSRMRIGVQLMDASGGAVTTGGPRVTLSTTAGTFSGCTTSCQATDDGDGTYGMMLTAASTPSTATITGTVNGKPMGDSVTVTFVPPPAPTITSTVPALTGSPTASFSFTGSTGTAFQCSLDGGAFASCASPYTTPPVADGSHTFSVDQVDTSSSVASAPASATWTVDQTPPAPPVIGGGPDAFTLTGEAGATFACSLDGGTFSPCASGVSFGALPPGGHTLQVVASDTAGNRGAPASYSWTVPAPAPTTGRCSAAGDVHALTTVAFGKVWIRVRVDADCDYDWRSRTVNLHNAHVLVQLDSVTLIDAQITSVVLTGSTATVTGTYKGSPFTISLVDRRTSDSLTVGFPGFPTTGSLSVPRDGIRIDLCS